MRDVVRKAGEVKIINFKLRQIHGLKIESHLNVIVKTIFVD